MMEQIIIFSMMMMSFLIFTTACIVYAVGDFKVVLNENKIAQKVNKNLK